MYYAFLITVFTIIIAILQICSSTPFPLPTVHHHQSPWHQNATEGDAWRTNINQCNKYKRDDELINKMLWNWHDNKNRNKSKSKMKKYRNRTKYSKSVDKHVNVVRRHSAHLRLPSTHQVLYLLLLDTMVRLTKQMNKCAFWRTYKHSSHTHTHAFMNYFQHITLSHASMYATCAERHCATHCDQTCNETYRQTVRQTDRQQAKQTSKQIETGITVAALIYLPANCIGICWYAMPSVVEG